MFIKTGYGAIFNLSNATALFVSPHREDMGLIKFIAAKREYNLHTCGNYKYALEVLDDIYNAIARGDRVYTMPKVPDYIYNAVVRETLDNKDKNVQK